MYNIDHQLCQKVFFLCVMWYEMTVHTVSVLTLNCLNIYCILNVMSTFNIVKIKCLKKKSTHIYWFIYWFFNRYRVFNLLKLQSGPILMQNVPCSLASLQIDYSLSLSPRGGGGRGCWILFFESKIIVIAALFRRKEQQ